MSLPGEISLVPERTTAEKRRREKSAEAVVAKEKPAGMKGCREPEDSARGRAERKGE